MTVKFEQPTAHHFLVTTLTDWVAKGNLIEAMDALPSPCCPSEFVAIWWVPGGSKTTYGIDNFAPCVTGARLVFLDRGSKRDDMEGLIFGKGVVRVQKGRNWLTVEEDSLTVEEIQEYGL